MPASTLAGPATIDLRNALATVFTNGRVEDVDVTERQTNVHTSTFPSEVISIRVRSGEPLRVFCKYADPTVATTLSYRNGVAFEAMIYESLLRPLGLSTAPYYGHATDDASGGTWLFLGALDPLARLSVSADPFNDMVRAARWIGDFHRTVASRAESVAGQLTAYDPDYFRGWAERALEFSRPLLAEYPWMTDLIRRSDRFVELLICGRPTLIHGEYYPKNVLVEQGVIYPVDWETAAIAAGEIDLASLTDNWPATTQSDCADAYAAARWAGDPPDAFADTLDAARLYLQLRWLGDHPDTTVQQSLRWRVDELRRVGQRLGLI